MNVTLARDGEGWGRCGGKSVVPSINILVPVARHPYYSGAGECFSVSSTDWPTCSATSHLLYTICTFFKQS